MKDMIINLTGRLKAGDVVIFPEYRPDPAILMVDRFGIERPLLARYANGDLVAPRYFDAVILIGRNMRNKAMKRWLESEEAKQLMHDHREHCEPEDLERQQLADNFIFALNGFNFVPGGVDDGE